MEIEGIVIRTSRFRDNDAMLTILSYDKIYSVLARGVLKIDSKNAHRVDLFSKSNFSILKTKDGYSLKNGQLIESYSSIKKDIVGLGVLDFISELTNKVIVSDDCGKLYSYLNRTLSLLNSKFDPWTLLLIYFAKVLNVSGFGLNVDSCQICHRTTSIRAVSYQAGGFICEDCLSAFNGEITKVRKLKILRYIFKVEPEMFDHVSFEKDECKEIFEELVNFTENVAQVELKSAQLLKSL